MDSYPPEDEGEEAVPLPNATIHTVRIARSRDRGRALVPPLELRVLAGPDVGLTHRASGDRIVIGIHPKADVVLQDKTVSRFHCEIVVEGERVAIRDLGSRNGTVVNGLGVAHAYVHPGCRIVVGCTELEFGIGSDSVEVELSNENR